MFVMKGWDDMEADGVTRIFRAGSNNSLTEIFPAQHVSALSPRESSAVRDRAEYRCNLVLMTKTVASGVMLTQDAFACRDMSNRESLFKVGLFNCDGRRERCIKLAGFIEGRNYGKGGYTIVIEF